MEICGCCYLPVLKGKTTGAAPLVESDGGFHLAARLKLASKVRKFYKNFSKDADLFSNVEGVHSDFDQTEFGSTKIAVISSADS